MAFKIKPKAATGAQQTPPPQKVAEPAPLPHEKETAEAKVGVPQPAPEVTKPASVEVLELRDRLAAKERELGTAISELAAAKQKAERDAGEAKIRSDATIGNLTKKLEAKGDELGTAKCELDKAKAAQEETKKELAAARSALDAKEGELTDARDEKGTATDRAEVAERTLETVRSELGMAKTEFTKAKEELAKLRASGMDSSEREAELEAKTAENEATIDALIESAEAKAQEVGERDARIAGLETELEQHNATIDSLIEAAETRVQEAGEKDARIAELEAQLAEAERSVGEINTRSTQETAVAANLLHALTQEKESLAAELAQVREDNIGLLSNQDQRVADLEARVLTAERDAEEKTARVAELETQALENDGVIEGLNTRAEESATRIAGLEARVAAAETDAGEKGVVITQLEARLAAADNEAAAKHADASVHTGLDIFNAKEADAIVLMSTVDPERFHRILHELATKDEAGMRDPGLDRMYKKKANALLSNTERFDDILVACGLNNENMNYVVDTIDLDRINAAGARIMAGANEDLKARWTTFIG